MAAPAPLIGRLERVDAAGITGWALDPRDPSRKVELLLELDGVAVGTLRADRFRPDLAANGVGDGHHGFLVHLPAPLDGPVPRRVGLRRAADLVELEGSPVLLPANGDPRAAVAAILAADGPERALRARELAERLAELVPAPDPAQAALLRRWGVAGQAAAPRRPVALVIDEAAPDAGRDAGSNALIAHMRALIRLGCAVHFVPAWSMEMAPEQAAALAALGVQPWRAPWAGSVEEVLRALAPDIVYVHRFTVMARVAALVRHCRGEARLVYLLADLHALRAARQAALAGGPAPEDLRAAELAAVRAADACIVHSRVELELLREAVPEAALHLAAWDVTPRPRAAPPAARLGVAFIGSYGHAPNLDAAFTLLAEIMPRVWAEAPGLPCLLAGSDLPGALRAAAAQAEGPVEVLGQVPALDAVWDRVRLSIAPLRFGAGLKGKVMDSLAAGIPCLCSPIAAEGFDFPPALAACVAEGPVALARAVVVLHGDQAELARLGAAGLDFVADRFSAARLDAALHPALGLPEGVHT